MVQPRDEDSKQSRLSRVFLQQLSLSELESVGLRVDTVMPLPLMFAGRLLQSSTVGSLLRAWGDQRCHPPLASTQSHHRDPHSGLAQQSHRGLQLVSLPRLTSSSLPEKPLLSLGSNSTWKWGKEPDHSGGKSLAGLEKESALFLLVLEVPFVF